MMETLFAKTMERKEMMEKSGSCLHTSITFFDKRGKIIAMLKGGM